MIVARTIAHLDRVLGRPRSSRGFVPTMGALHAGHLALIEAAHADCEQVVASIFVNPKQFDDPGDLARYPRPEADDLEQCRAAGVDVLFLPSVDEMYPADLATSIHVDGAALGFEGAHRPGHFDGVALVCVKLFGLVRPTVAYFGQKDAQQVAVLRQVCRDLNLTLDLAVVPTRRDADGLALSSRNARLSADERGQALALPRALRAGLDAHRRGEDPVAAARAALGTVPIDYAGIATFDGDPTLVVAARVGTTRLIDNVPLDHPARAGLE
ncbi:MAG: pantoate--beta-alanine ligase [Acidobacteria bacterium]|nr:pantoate--beta-alanine ligase [Acidobacteriota bacterium]